MSHNDDIDAKALEWHTNRRERLYDSLQTRADGTNGQPTTASSLTELFKPDKDEFVHLVYRTFLGRQPNQEELKKSLSQLNSGDSKPRVAALVRYSSEATQKPQKLKLTRARIENWLTDKLPLLAKIYQGFTAILGAGSLKRAVLVQQQALIQLRGELERSQTLYSRTRGLCEDMIASEFRTQILQQEIREGLKKAHRKMTEMEKETALEYSAFRDRQQELSELIDSLEPGGSLANGKGTPADEDFYIAFENHFRGSEELIQDRLSYYLPIIGGQLNEELKSAPMIDIGCGRGEWIGLLQKQGYKATGIDLNRENVSTCIDKGLPAQAGDGLEWLRRTKSQSLGLISSFHVIEHLSLSQVNSMLVEALRCLKPGGIIILETPNPENLITAAHRFYTDPSHKNPVPPDLTAFLLKHRGFTQVKIHRLHPAPESEHIKSDDITATRLNSLLYGPQDYAAIAIKP